MDTSQDYFYEVNADNQIEIERYIGYDDIAVILGRIDDMPVTAIKTHAFAGMDVVEIVVPEGVETIESEAFAACDNLERVTLPGSLAKLERGVFMGSERLREIAFANENERYYVDEGILYNRDERALILCPPGLKLETFSVPMGIEIIAADAFYANRQLEYVRLPMTLKVIEAGAFLFTGAMRIIELPPFLETIEPDSFLVGSGSFAEKPFEIYAFPDTLGYRYALDNHISVHPLHAIVTD